MRAQTGTAFTVAFFDSDADVGAGTLQAVIKSTAGVVQATLGMTETAAVQDFYLSDTQATLLVTGNYIIHYTVNGTTVRVEDLVVGLHPVTSYVLGVDNTLAVDADLIGGSAKFAQLWLMDTDGAGIFTAAAAVFTGNVATTSIAVEDGQSLDFSINGGATLSAVFDCYPAVVEGVGGTYAAGVAGDTAEVTIDGLPTITVDVDGVAGTAAAYAAYFNTVLRGSYADVATGLRLTTDSQGSSSTIVLANFTGAFAVKTGLTEGTYNPTPASCNVGVSTAVTFLEVKSIIEDAVKTAVAGDLITATQDASGFLVLTETTGATGTASTIDLEAGTSALVAALGLAGLGSRSGLPYAYGDSALFTQAVYSATTAAFEAEATFSITGQYFPVWLVSDTVDGVYLPASYTGQALVLQETGLETVLITAGTLPGSGSNGAPHTSATVIVSTQAGEQVAQGVTNTSGELRLTVPPGTYVFTLLKSGVVYTENNWVYVILASEAVSRDPTDYAEYGNVSVQAVQLATAAFEPTVTAVPAPADLCEVYLDLVRLNGDPLWNATIQVSLISRPELFSGAGVWDTRMTFRTDSNGHAEFNLVQGTKVEVAIAPLGLRRILTVPSAAGPTNLLTLLSGTDDPFDVMEPDVFQAPGRTL